MAESGEGKQRVLMVLSEAAGASQDRDDAASWLSSGVGEPMGAGSGCVAVPASLAGETFAGSSLGEVS
jgi:hypothetical protein